MIIHAAAMGLVLLANAQGTGPEGSKSEDRVVSGSRGAQIVNRTTSVRDRRRERDVDRIYRRFLRGKVSATDAARQIVDRSEIETLDQDVTGVMFPLGGPDSTPEQEEKTAELMQEITRLIKLRGDFQRHMQR